jgi:hypothetical protein
MSLIPQFGAIVPAPNQQLLANAYLAFNTGGANDFIQQYLPEVYEQEVERYGNRTLSGFLRMVGAEMPMTSDQVIWSEQNRLHIAYSNCVNAVAGAVSTITVPVPTAPGVTRCVIGPGQTIVAMDNAGNELKCIVTATTGVGGGVLTVAPYTQATTASLAGIVKIFVFGSEFVKGAATSNAGAGALANNTALQPQITITPTFTQFANSPVIIRNVYTINGSDMAQIGWVEVATEDGTTGYLWYLKAESETRLRFEDYLEMVCVEGNLATAGSAATAAGFKGTQGLFQAVQARGNVEIGFAGASGLDDFDEILKNLDTQGAIEENMLFLNRSTSLEFDNMLSNVSQGVGGGTAYGLFENSEEMALNLGFSGFRRGSYDFYKTDWKYLNDASTRGAQVGISSIEGILVPAGTSTVYDQILGTNIRRPFLHVRYRASQTEDRRMKSWLTGSAGGAYTSNLDAMEVNFLSERCLVVQAANNFVLFQGI